MTPASHPATDRALLRRELRARRRALGPAQQQLAAHKLAGILRSAGVLMRYRDIAFYLPNDGEIDPTPLLRQALQRGLNCYLPVVDRGTMAFYRYRAGEPLLANRYGIPEPLKMGSPRLPWSLGAVLVPLVGFDDRGARLGMGGGYYDRCFSYQRNGLGRRPRLIGLAHHCQRVDELATASWDINMSAIATDREWIDCR